jgi:nuclear transport factor 2 (NTF2) superfamily protein
VTLAGGFTRTRRLIKELWAFRDNRIAVRFAYEWHDDSGQ